MELPEPSGIADVGLSARNVLGISGIHKNDLKAMLFENLEGRDPVDPGRFHRNASYTAGLEPFGKIMQILCERAECAYRHIVTVGVRCSHMHGRTDADRGSSRIDYLQISLVAGDSLHHGVRLHRQWDKLKSLHRGGFLAHRS